MNTDVSIVRCDEYEAETCRRALESVLAPLAGLELKNSMQVITISMEEPTLDDTMPDNERVTWAVQAATTVP